MSILFDPEVILGNLFLKIPHRVCPCVSVCALLSEYTVSFIVVKHKKSLKCLLIGKQSEEFY